MVASGEGNEVEENIGRGRSPTVHCIPFCFFKLCYHGHVLAIYRCSFHI